ncbi:unnamed protein product [Lathyrus oleraceus]
MEQHVVRSRGHSRRQRNDEKEWKFVPEAKRQVVERKPIALVGRYVLKKFLRNGVFLGKVVYYEYGLYKVIYEDGDYKDLESEESRLILINDVVDFDVDLVKRMTKLEKLVLHNRDKVVSMYWLGCMCLKCSMCLESCLLQM